jgi:hypothetical protein
VVVLDPGSAALPFDRLHSLQGAALLADGDQLTILRLDPEAASVIAIPYYTTVFPPHCPIWTGW